MSRFEDWEVKERYPMKPGTMVEQVPTRPKRRVYILETPQGRLLARSDRAWSEGELTPEVKQFSAVEE